MADGFCANDDVRVEWAGGVHETRAEVFGAQHIQQALHEDLELVFAEPADGCGAGLANTNSDGKIVLIQRGTCLFAEKALNAQNAGATALVIYNNAEGMMSMSGDDRSILILAVLVSQADGEGLAAAISQGTTTISLRC